MGETQEVLRQEVLARIHGLLDGERLPPERELCQSLGVARETLRQVLGELTQEGYLVRRRGAGTFVARSKITQQTQIRSFTEDMRARRMSSSSKLLWHRREPAGARLGAVLRLSPGEPVLTLRRLRLADGEPMALETVSLPDALLPGLEPEVLADASLYTILDERFGIEVWAGDQTLEATVTDREESELLGVPLLSPGLLVERVTWTRDGRRVEATKSTYRGDRYRFHIDLARPA